MVDPRALGRTLKTVRGRSVAFVTLATFATLVCGTSLVLLLFARSLEASLDQTLRAQAGDRALLLNQGTDPSSLVSLQRSESFVWIGSPDGALVAQGGQVTPIDSPVPDVLGGVTDVEMRAEERHVGAATAEIEVMEMRVASVVSSDGTLVVITGAEREGMTSTVRRLMWLFVLAVPLLSSAVAALAWIGTGRALAPVEQIRRRTTEVSGQRLTERVPVPDTGDEIHDLAVTMNEMLDRLESHQRTMQQFTADASHELKSPIANLRALLETTRISDPAWADLRDRLTSESDRLKELVENLLFLASHSDPSSSRRKSTVHLDDLLFDEAQLVTATGRLEVDIDRVGPADVLGDGSDLRRLIRNLVDNAARHADSTLSFSTHTEPEAVTVVIADDGPGIPEHDRERVFERFTRLDDSRERGGGGTGLGLSIVRQVAGAHGGTVKIGERAGGGTEVRVTLPGAGGAR